MIQIIQASNGVFTGDHSWQIVRHLNVAGYGFNNRAWPVFRTKNYEPNIIMVDVSSFGRGSWYMDTKSCKLHPKRNRGAFDLIPCAAAEDEHIMLVTGDNNRKNPNVDVAEVGAETLYYNCIERPTPNVPGQVDRSERLAIRFDDPDGYVLTKVLPKEWKRPFGVVYSWRFGSIRLTPSRLEEFEENPKAYFEKEKLEIERVDAAIARHDGRKRLAEQFRQIVAKYDFAATPINPDNLLTVGADAAFVQFGGSTVAFCYDEGGLDLFAKCMEQIHSVCAFGLAPVWLNGGELIKQTVSDIDCCTPI